VRQIRSISRRYHSQRQEHENSQLHPPVRPCMRPGSPALRVTPALLFQPESTFLRALDSDAPFDQSRSISPGTCSATPPDQTPALRRQCPRFRYACWSPARTDYVNRLIPSLRSTESTSSALFRAFPMGILAPHSCPWHPLLSRHSLSDSPSPTLARFLFIPGLSHAVSSGRRGLQPRVRMRAARL
jgi:hypothetical protein